MPKIQINDLPEFSKNPAIKDAATRYKNYCTIRRDLREADKICSYVINLHESIKRRYTTLSQISDTSFLVRASVMHAIVLYARWFKATKGKTKLKPNDYFSPNSTDMSVHEELIRHRDKYIAHNQLDLLGSDRVWVNIDTSGKFISSYSDFIEEMWLQGKELNMSTFQKCVHIVHNKIDGETIPNLQNKLDEQLRSLS